MSSRVAAPAANGRSARPAEAQARWLYQAIASPRRRCTRSGTRASPNYGHTGRGSGHSHRRRRSKKRRRKNRFSLACQSSHVSGLRRRSPPPPPALAPSRGRRVGARRSSGPRRARSSHTTSSTRRSSSCSPRARAWRKRSSAQLLGPLIPDLRRLRAAGGEGTTDCTEAPLE